MKPDITIVVVTYNESNDILTQCFASVKASLNVTTELIIVDNSANTRIEALAKTYDAQYIANRKNLGFAAAVNIGMKRRKGRYVLLLNPDTSFSDHVLADMVGHLDTDKEVGVASCVIRYPNGTLQESIRRFPTLIDQLQILFKIPHFIKTKAIERYMMRDVDPLATQDVDSIMGAFMFIREKTLQEVGLFDERYFIWFEEVDYCHMVHDHGWKIRHYGDVEIMHHKGHTFGTLPTLRKQKWIRTSMKKYMRKHHGFLPWSILWVVNIPAIVMALGVSIVKPR